METITDVYAALRAGQPFAEYTRSDGIVMPERRSTRQIASVSFRIVLSGSCRILPPAGSGHWFPELVLGPGDMALFGPRVVHTLVAHNLADQAGSAVESLYCGYLQGPRQPHPLLRDLANITYIPVRAACPIEFESLLRFLRLELEDSKQPPDLTPALVEASLTYVLRAWRRNHARDTSSPHADTVVARALRAMHTHIEHPWTVAELAAVAGLSRAAFAQRFTTAIGQPPLAYLTSVRLAEAAKLLRDTDRPITQIARVTGYSSTITLTRAFRREQGITPGAYRHEQTRIG